MKAVKKQGDDYELAQYLECIALLGMTTIALRGSLNEKGEIAH